MSADLAVASSEGSFVASAAVVRAGEIRMADWLVPSLDDDLPEDGTVEVSAGG
jgi:hypothetical protein